MTTRVTTARPACLRCTNHDSDSTPQAHPDSRHTALHAADPFSDPFDERRSRRWSELSRRREVVTAEQPKVDPSILKLALIKGDCILVD
jgi:hypothetical protein